MARRPAHDALRRRLAGCTTADEVCRATRQAGPDAWTPIAVATAWNRLARHWPKSAGGLGRVDLGRLNVVTKVLTEAQDTLGTDTFDARALVSLLHAWAVLRLVPANLSGQTTETRVSELSQGSASCNNTGAKGFAKRFESICVTIQTRVGELRAQELAALLYALGVLRRNSMPEITLLKAACAEVTLKVETFGTREIANALYGLAKGQRRHETTLAALCNRMCSIVCAATPQGISNSLYAVGLLRYHHKPLVASIVANLPARVHGFTEQELSNSAYAFALLRHTSEAPLMEALCAEAQRRLPYFQPQGLATFIYALGVLGYRNIQFLNLACLQATTCLKLFNEQDIANTIYALGILEFCHDVFLDAAIGEIPYRLEAFAAQGLSNILYAMALLEYRPTAFLRIFCAHARKRLSTASEQYVANIVYSLGLLNFPDREFLAAVGTLLASERGRLASEMTIQGLANTVYGLALLISGTRRIVLKGMKSPLMAAGITIPMAQGLSSTS